MTVFNEIFINYLILGQVDEFFFSEVYTADYADYFSLAIDEFDPKNNLQGDLLTIRSNDAIYIQVFI